MPDIEDDKPTREIRGMAYYYERLLSEHAMHLYGTTEINFLVRAEDPQFMLRRELFTQQVNDAVREAYFRGAAYGLAMKNPDPIVVNINCGNGEHAVMELEARGFKLKGEEPS